MSSPAGLPAAITEPLGRSAPNAREELLLRAALLEGPDAALAWRAWLGGGALEAAHGGERRLMGAVYRNLARLGADAPELVRLRGIHRSDWYRNQLLFAAAADAIGLLHGAGIPTLVVKGAALAAVHY